MKRFKTARVSFAIVFISIVVCLFFSVVGSYADDVKDTPLPVTEQITGQDGDLTLLAGDVGVTMDYTEVNVAKGDHYGLNVTTNPVNASITWSIGNALVANVSSDGIITGLKEGTTTIIASFEYNGELYAASCVVRVGPATGLYKIKNKNSSKYLHVNSGSIANLTTVQQYSSYSASSPQYMIRQLWRVAYVSTNGGFYTIRPYYKMDMLLCGYNGSACITSASYTDSYQDCASGMWEIYTIGNAYIFNYNGLTSFTMQVYNASSDNGAAVKAASDTGTNSSRWTLEAVSSAPAGIKMYNSSGTPITSAPTHYIGVGETKTIVGRGLKIQFYANTTPLVVRAYNNNINHTSSNTSVVTITTKGKAKGIAEGNAVITAKVTYSSQSLTTTYNIGVIAVPSGKYFFENRTTEKYLQIDDGETNTVGAVMEQWAFDGGDDQKWVVTSLNNGYYKIVSSETGYALSVPSGSETAENVSLVQQAYTGATRQQWKITETANGSYKIKARSSESYTEKDLVMDIQYSLLYQNDNGIDVQQRAYLDNNSYMDEWYLYGSSDYTLMYIGATDGDPLMLPIVEAVDQALEDNAGMKGNSFTSLTKDELLVYLSSTSVFSCITHGLQNSIVTSDEDLTVSDINALDDSAFDSLTFVYLGACLTGQGRNEANNLVNAFYNKGADTVLGFTESVIIPETNFWTQRFMEALSLGLTINEAIQFADDEVARNTELNLPFFSINDNTRYILGSTQVVPCDN